MSERGGVGEVDGDLAVLDAPGGAGVLALYAHRVHALLQITGLIHDQHRVLVVQLLDHKAADVIAYRVGIPTWPSTTGAADRRGRIPGMFSKRPAVLARQIRQQPEHERLRSAPGFHPDEPSRDQSEPRTSRATGQVMTEFVAWTVFAGLPVRNLDAAVAWYGDIFSREQPDARPAPGIAEYYLAEGSIREGGTLQLREDQARAGAAWSP